MCINNIKFLFTPQATAELLYAVITAQLKSTFHKINIHAAMTPADIQKCFKPVFEQARALKEAFERRVHDEQLAATSKVICIVHKCGIQQWLESMYIVCTMTVDQAY